MDHEYPIRQQIHFYHQSITNESKLFCSFAVWNSMGFSSKYFFSFEKFWSRKEKNDNIEYSDKKLIPGEKNIQKIAILIYVVAARIFENYL
jgi:hypothetical protein